MKQGQLIGLAVSGIVAGLILMATALSVGGGQIRTASSLYEHNPGELVLETRVLQRGVPVTIEYDRGDVLPSGQAALLQFKSDEQTITISGVDPSKLNRLDARFTTVIPCDMGQLAKKEKARLMLVDNKRGLLAVSDELRIEEPGPECFYRQ